MNKPRRKTLNWFDWHKCTEFIESKYGIRTRDFQNSHSQFGEWCDGKGYGQTDPEGETRGSSKIWFQEYQNDITSGIIDERPYQNFWHWLLDQVPVSRGGSLNLYEGMADDAEPWQKQILGYYLAEFGEGPYHTDW